MRIGMIFSKNEFFTRLLFYTAYTASIHTYKTILRNLSEKKLRKKKEPDLTLGEIMPKVTILDVW